MQLKYIQFLESHGAAEIEHSSEDFLSHLKGVMDILKSWKAPEYLCLAGLFHSVYGTEVFQDSLIPKDLRPKVQSLIGEEAEEIVYLFGIMSRRDFLLLLNKEGDFHIRSRFDKKKTSLNSKKLEDLCNLYVANRLEQHPRWPEEYKYSEFEEMKLIRKFIYEKAANALSMEYRF